MWYFFFFLEDESTIRENTQMTLEKVDPWAVTLNLEETASWKGIFHTTEYNDPRNTVCLLILCAFFQSYLQQSVRSC